MTSSHFKKVKLTRGLSLLEVIVVLAIISMTMISAISVVLKANSVIKSNEIQDTANDLLLQSFELLKSPDKVKVLQGGFSELSQYGISTVYSINFDTSLNRNGYLKKASQPGTQCDNSSEFNVKLSAAIDRPYPICIKITITPVGSVSTGITRYDISILLFYSSSDRAIQDTYTLNRYEGFIQIT